MAKLDKQGLNTFIRELDKHINAKINRLNLNTLEQSQCTLSEMKKEFAIGSSDGNISSVTEWSQVTVPSSFNARQRACCYGNGYYIVAGTSGQMIYSTDGVNWAQAESFTSDVITGLAYGNGRFIAVDSNGKIFVSSMPTKWTLVYENELIIESVRYINNRFVSVGQGGFIATSQTGTEWKQLIPFTSNNLIDITYGNGYYVAVGASGSIFRSINTEDWFDHSISDFGDIRTAMYSGNGFVAGGAGGKIAYSFDGIHWDMATNNTTSTVSWIRGFAYAEGRIYTVMYTSAGKGEIWVSVDNGVSWSVVKSGVGRLWCVCYGDGIFITSGDNGAVYALNLGIEWQSTEPYSENNVWYRYISILSNGDRIISESYKSELAK